jgi:hypothetical protein
MNDHPSHSTGAQREKPATVRYDYMPSQIVNDSYGRVAEFGSKKYTKFWNNKWAALLNVEAVEKMQIFLPKDCANLVISNLLALSTKKLEFAASVVENATSTTSPNNCVEDVMIDISNAMTLTIKSGSLQITKNGHLTTPLKPLKAKVGFMSFESLTHFLNSVMPIENSNLCCLNVVSQEANIALNGTSGAQSAGAESICIGITITLPENTEAFFAQSITMGLGFWETILKVLNKLYNISEREVLLEREGTDNWRKGLPVSQIASSLQRHLWAYMEGEEVDSESGLSHLDHLLWNAVALVYNKEKVLCDDRIKTRITS